MGSLVVSQTDKCAAQTRNEAQQPGRRRAVRRTGPAQTAARRMFPFQSALDPFCELLACRQLLGFVPRMHAGPRHCMPAGQARQSLAAALRVLHPAPLTVRVLNSSAPSPAPQELAKFEIDSRNIVINQVIFPEEGEAAGAGACWSP